MFLDPKFFTQKFVGEIFLLGPRIFFMTYDVITYLSSDFYNENALPLPLFRDSCPIFVMASLIENS